MLAGCSVQHWNTPTTIYSSSLFPVVPELSPPSIRALWRQALVLVSVRTVEKGELVRILISLGHDKPPQLSLHLVNIKLLLYQGRGTGFLLLLDVFTVIFLDWEWAAVCVCNIVLCKLTKFGST
ncbi:hypothetical protein VNO77_00312 [Canavalia gladiata]|uniref:Uncharacterized protein n=1 Tax=Canavalia gladiata TaxID=3824 RepID=A0AAN9R183_CANGL